MALRPRQVRFYTDTFNIARKTRMTNGDFAYHLLYSGIACKYFSSPNPVEPFRKIGQMKQESRYTNSKLHCDVDVDIRDEDMVEVISVSAQPRPWFRVAGEPEQRGGVANRAAVELVPAAAPVLI